MILFKRHYQLITLLSIVLLCNLSTATNTTTSKQTPQIETITSQKYPFFNGKRIDTKRIQQINQFINSKLQNCQLQSSSGLLYNCEIIKQDYPQFLYDFFSQQLFSDFLKNHQLKIRKSIKNNQKQLKKYRQHVHNVLIDAYLDFVQVYRPNQKVTVEEVYVDFYTHDLTMLQYVEHFPEKYIELINVLKQRVGKQANTPSQYLSVKGKSKQQLQQDQAKIFVTYFGNCTSQTQCKISIKAYPFYLKDLFFYSSPQIGRVQNGYLYVKSETDFDITEYFIKEVNRLKSTLGEVVNYQERNTHFKDLVLKLKQLLRKKELKKYLTTKQEQQDVEFAEQL